MKAREEIRENHKMRHNIWKKYLKIVCSWILIFSICGLSLNVTEASGAGVEMERESQETVDFILAVGGGSVIDGTKLVAAGLLYDGDPWELVPANIPDTIGDECHAADDVPLNAEGPGSEYFQGVMDNTEVFFGIMRALGIDATKNVK